MRVISSTTTAERSTELLVATVLLSTSTPRGFVFETARESPFAAPVASTTTGHLSPSEQRAWAGSLQVGIPKGCEQRHFFRVATQQAHLRSGGTQHPRLQEAEPPVPDHQNFVIHDFGELFHHLEAGGQRLAENSLLIFHGVGNGVKVSTRQTGVFRKDSRPVENAEDAPAGTMPLHAARAPGAASASAIYLAHDPSAQERVRLWPRHLAHELMAQHAPEIHISANEFQVGGANPREPHPDEGFAPRRIGNRHLFQRGAVFLEHVGKQWMFSFSGFRAARSGSVFSRRCAAIHSRDLRASLTRPTPRCSAITSSRARSSALVPSKATKPRLST